MIESVEECAKASDEELVRDLRFLAERERRSAGAVLVALGEFDYRRLYREEGYHSLFDYCMRSLKFDESAAYRHITAARVVRRFPEALPMVVSGELTMTSLLLLSPALTHENRSALFAGARGRSKREVELLVAGLAPGPERPDAVRILPVQPPAWEGAREIAPLPAFPAWQAIVPASPERIRVGFDAAVELMKLIDRAKQVLRHKYPEGRLEDLVREAFELLLERKDPQRKLAMKSEGTAAPEPRLVKSMKTGRYIPMWVRRAVWTRDEGRCAWRFADGTVCGSKDWLEYDHVVPFARGGSSGTPRNIRLTCRTHNQLAAQNAGLGRL